MRWHAGNDRVSPKRLMEVLTIYSTTHRTPLSCSVTTRKEYHTNAPVVSIFNNGRFMAALFLVYWRIMFSLVREINLLWENVYPHLAKHIGEVYGRSGGAVVEVGPFCGVIYDLVRQGTGTLFRIASFPSAMGSFYIEEIKKRNMGDMIDILETTPELTGIDDETADLIVFRGALFFPSLFKIDYKALLRVLKPGGTAFVGGGFGRHTPAEVIRSIAERSRELNYLIGKTEVTAETIKKDLEADNITKGVEIITEGGLWIIMRKS